MTTTGGETPSREALLSIVETVRQRISVGDERWPRTSRKSGNRALDMIAAELTASQSSPQAALTRSQWIDTVIRDVCETDPADVDDDQTVRINVDDLRGIIEQAMDDLQNSQPAHGQGEQLAWHFESVHDDAGKTTGINIMAHDKVIAVLHCGGRECDYKAANDICMAHAVTAPHCGMQQGSGAEGEAQPVAWRFVQAGEIHFSAVDPATFGKFLTTPSEVTPLYAAHLPIRER